jgi:hypothetical protein
MTKCNRCNGTGREPVEGIADALCKLMSPNITDGSCRACGGTGEKTIRIDVTIRHEDRYRSRYNLE